MNGPRQNPGRGPGAKKTRDGQRAGHTGFDPISLPYLAAVELRNLFRGRIFPPRPPIPAYTIGVGNITTGGTGKTTIAAWLAAWHARRHKRVVLLSHGVGGHRRPLVVTDGKSTLARVAECGDEAVLLCMMAPGVPVISGRNRSVTANLACRDFQAEIIIADDAFHCLDIDWDCNIVVFNSRDGLGNRRLLPAGRLREPLRNLGRADIFWFNHSDLAGPGELDFLREELPQYNGRAKIVTSFYRYRGYRARDGRKFSSREMKGRRAKLIAAVGTPEIFRLMAERAGIEVVGCHFFRDHHFFTPREISSIEAGDADCFLVTEKDITRFPPVATPVPVICPSVELVVSNWPPS